MSYKCCESGVYMAIPSFCSDTSIRMFYDTAFGRFTCGAIIVVGMNLKFYLFLKLLSSYQHALKFLDDAQGIRFV